MRAASASASLSASENASVSAPGAPPRTSVPDAGASVLVPSGPLLAERAPDCSGLSVLMVRSHYNHAQFLRNHFALRNARAQFDAGFWRIRAAPPRRAA